MKTNDTVVIHLKKGNLNANNAYQYHKLEQAGFYFVPCLTEEDGEELICTFQTAGMKPLNQYKKMREADRYGCLIQVIEAVTRHPEYDFSIKPDNLYLDMQGRVRIMLRDVTAPEADLAAGRLADIKSLIGAMLQRRYRYDHFREGGQKLLLASKKTRFLAETDDLEEISRILIERQQEVKDREQREKTLVNKQRYRMGRVIGVITFAGCIAAVGLFVWLRYTVLIPEQSALAAERAYMENDMVAVADALAPIPVNRMDVHEKYLLAAVYIRSGSVDTFDLETKEKLLSRLSYSGDENVLDYWIYLGRLDADQALDVAMKMSDNQLILYAYLQKLEMISEDTTLSGEEKNQQIENLKGKIKNLADTLGIEYQETPSQESEESISGEGIPEGDTPAEGIPEGDIPAEGMPEETQESIPQEE